MIYDCIIIGTGPAGLATAFELLKAKPNIKVLMLDKARISSGGLRNDCKMNFTYPVGFPTDCWSEETASRYLERVENFLQPEILETKNLDKYKARAEKIGAKLLSIRQSHLGTDGGIQLIKALTGQLSDLGVEIALQEEALSVKHTDKTLTTSLRTIKYHNMVIAPGRQGFNFLRNVMSENNVPFQDNTIDVGIRIETTIERYSIVKDYYDPKFLFPEKTRTFCTNSGAAHVVQEKYTASDGSKYFLVNGHAFSTKKKSSGLANFAMLRSIKLTEPLASGQDYAEFLASLAMLTGGGHPIMQRVGDFRMGKRSTRETLNSDFFDFKPSLSSCTPGDISIAIPAKFLHSIWKALKRLDNIVPGILHPSTMMYYPEIKLYANKPVFQNEHFMVQQGLYLIGDGAGTSRGITAAWASGIRAADGIIG
ncbi:MAG: pyridine nucleotide-disulfide oxidoreductase [Treponema sp.]|nr:MAG: pyridine nucleotide-disulfide oxidoreductase [Treponema sp.]